MQQHTVDINCDLGEGTSRQDCQLDASLMPYISRCNIACGGHAGNDFTMQQTLLNAKKHNILCGAHPGYPDPQNFGRISLPLEPDVLVKSIVKQISQLEYLATTTAQPLSHIKMHGALYNDAEKSTDLAELLCHALATHFSHLSLIGLAGGAMQLAAQKHGITFLREGFMDRAYLATGHLAPRTLEGSVHQDANTCVQQVLAMLHQHPMPILMPQGMTDNGPPLILQIDTLCLHGDSVIAPELVKHLNQTLQQHGYSVA